MRCFLPGKVWEGKWKEINFWASALLGLSILLQYDRNLRSNARFLFILGNKENEGNALLGIASFPLRPTVSLPQKCRVLEVTLHY
jgi:hypothetical protein